MKDFLVLMQRRQIFKRIILVVTFFSLFNLSVCLAYNILDNFLPKDEGELITWVLIIIVILAISYVTGWLKYVLMIMVLLGILVVIFKFLGLL